MLKSSGTSLKWKELVTNAACTWYLVAVLMLRSNDWFKFWHDPNKQNPNEIRCPFSAFDIGKWKTWVQSDYRQCSALFGSLSACHCWALACTVGSDLCFHQAPTRLMLWERTASVFCWHLTVSCSSLAFCSSGVVSQNQVMAGTTWNGVSRALLGLSPVLLISADVTSSVTIAWARQLIAFWKCIELL